MANPLVIVESPAKARTIAGFLGVDYTILASMGHVRDLPAKGLSVDTEHGFAVEYEVHASKKSVIAELKKALKGADELYLATDEDREGEAISWHLLEVLQPKVPVKRMVFHEITQAAIERAVEESRDVDSRARRRAGEPAHRRPPLRLPGVRGVLAQDPPGPVRRAGAVAERAPRRRARAGAHGLRGGRLLGPRRPRSRPTPPSPPRSPRSTAPRSPAAATSTPSATTDATTWPCSTRSPPGTSPPGSTGSRSRCRRSRRSRTRRSRSRRSSPRPSSRWAGPGCG